VVLTGRAHVLPFLFSGGKAGKTPKIQAFQLSVLLRQAGRPLAFFHFWDKKNSSRSKENRNAAAVREDNSNRKVFVFMTMVL
jgi:hypothetical protein